MAARPFSSCTITYCFPSCIQLDIPYREIPRISDCANSLPGSFIDRKQMRRSVAGLTCRKKQRGGCHDRRLSEAAGVRRDAFDTLE
jgi:hypothetical protein